METVETEEAATEDNAVNLTLLNEPLRGVGNTFDLVDQLKGSLKVTLTDQEKKEVGWWLTIILYTSCALFTILFSIIMFIKLFIQDNKKDEQPDIYDIYVYD